MFIAAKSWKELDPYNEVLFSLKKEENSDLWINLDDITNLDDRHKRNEYSHSIYVRFLE